MWLCELAKVLPKVAVPPGAFELWRSAHFAGLADAEGFAASQKLSDLAPVTRKQDNFTIRFINLLRTHEYLRVFLHKYVANSHMHIYAYALVQILIRIFKCSKICINMHLHNSNLLEYA